MKRIERHTVCQECQSHQSHRTCLFSSVSPKPQMNISTSAQSFLRSKSLCGISCGNKLKHRRGTPPVLTFSKHLAYRLAAWTCQRNLKQHTRKLYSAHPPENARTRPLPPASFHSASQPPRTQSITALLSNTILTGNNCSRIHTLWWRDRASHHGQSSLFDLAVFRDGQDCIKAILIIVRGTSPLRGSSTA